MVKASTLLLANGSGSTGYCTINNGGMLQAKTIKGGNGSTSFNWNDGTIQNYDASTDLAIPAGLTLKLAATGTHVFNIDLNRTGTVDAVLSDATAQGTLTKTGQGTLIFSGANTYSGDTQIAAGKLRLQNDLAMQNSSLDTSGTGLLDLSGISKPTLGGLTGSGNLTFPSNISELSLNLGTGVTKTYSGTLGGAASALALIKTGIGTQVLTGKMTYGGYAQINGGALSIMLGGRVSNANGSLGSNSGSTGAVVVTGTSSTWKNSGTLYVGDFGNGVLNIEAGGQVSNTFGILGGNSGGTGTVTVSGANSMWSNSEAVNVGKNGTGTLYVLGGAQVSDTYGVVAHNDGSTGSATISGVGSQWINVLDVYVGYGYPYNYGSPSSGTLNIEAGGQVSNVVGAIGYYSKSTGTATVTGAGSTWTNSSVFYIGKSGTGTLKIEAGGQVSNTSGYLGYDAGATGTATVTGAGSTWTNSGALYVGYNGAGTLKVDDGALVTARTIYASLSNLFGNGTITSQGAVLDTDIVFDAATPGQANVTFGSGGSLKLIPNGSGDLGAGYNGAAALRIADGNVVCSSSGYLGYNAGSVGTATVTGAGSTWNNSSTLYVGYYGAGTLTTEMGGLTVAKTLTLANYSGSTGTCYVDGGGTLQVGTITKGSGTAAFTWNDGTIQNYDAATDLSITAGVPLKIAATGTHTFQIDTNRTGTVSAVLSDVTTLGTLAKTGLGKLILSGVNKYTGETTIAAGTLSVSKIVVSSGGSNLGNATSAVVLGDSVNQGTLLYTGAAATYTRGFTVNSGGGQLLNSGTGTLTVDTGVIAAGGLFTVGGASQSITINSAISGAGGLTKTGANTVILGGVNSYTGDTTISAGTLQLGNNLALQNSALDISGTGSLTVSTGVNTPTFGGLVGSGNRTLASNVTGLTLNLGSGATKSYSGILGSATAGMMVTKTGAGTQVFTGANTYTGKTTVQAGTLVLGTAAQNAVLSLGGADLQAGKIVFDYTGGTTPAATVAGLLGTSYSAGAWNVGQLQSTTADSTHGLGWVDDGVSQVKVAYTFYGDADLNGTVNSADLAKVLANYNMAGMAWSQGDFDYNGTVNSADLAKVLANYNLALPDPGISGGLADLDADAIALLAEKGGEVSAVPEPSTAALLLGGLLGLLAWRRRG